MKEDFLHYIWKYKLFDSTQLRTVKDKEITILSTGLPNSDSGPDFFNGKINLEETTWAGNIEIHIKSSDWYRHKHENDRAYDNVILHVVYEYDKPVLNANNEEIPTLELKSLINPNVIKNYSNLVVSKDWIPCGKQIMNVEDFTLKNWVDRLSIERLERKSIEIKKVLNHNKNDWESTFYQFLLKYFGLKVNAQPFEQLAINTPLKIIEKHNSLLSVEALLYGQSGFLDEGSKGEYFNSLKKEYQFLQAKFSLTPIDKSNWKFLRLRPSNFPTIRISQIAYLLKNNARMLSMIIDISDTNQLVGLFNCKASEYWEEHYQFGKKSKNLRVKKIGVTTINNLIINVVVPFLFVYGKEKNNEQLVDKSIEILENLNSEKNSIIKNWEKLGVKSGNALSSQSLLELKNNYCSEKKCLNCNIGNKILQS